MPDFGVAGNKRHSSVPEVFPGADETTPSRAEYFTWINNTNEGATAEQTLINFAFFRFLREKFGMQLDLYVFDAGAIDGAGFYGSTDSERFRRQFPEGFGPLAAAARKLGFRLGVWGGPDGFGDTPESARKRIEEMTALCRDHGFELFKFDLVCGSFVPEHETFFIEMLSRCRRYVPELILLNHRLPLSEAGLRHATTFLWEGAESYIDVHSFNPVTAPHHRAGALMRGLTPGLTRLAEDHGVCLSSCLDGWDDELILQAFGRSLILAPQIYGNPWLLRDSELPKLAGIFKLHRRFRDILVHADPLPERRYGPSAVSRGDGAQRFVTLRNLSWRPVERTIRLEELGLTEPAEVEVRSFHPRECRYGLFPLDGRVKVRIPPFRSFLLYAGRPLEGECSVPPDAVRDPEPVALGRLRQVEQPGDMAELYEAAAFAIDNNSLEQRSLERAGRSRYPAVRAARRAFFSQPAYRARMCADRNLFNADPGLLFGISPLMLDRISPERCCFRLDLGKCEAVDEVVLRTLSQTDLLPLLQENAVDAFVSGDLKEWRRVSFLACAGESRIPVGGRFRYLKLPVFPSRMVEVYALREGRRLSRAHWRANLFQEASVPEFKRIWRGVFRLPSLSGTRRLCVAVEGTFGQEAVCAAWRCGDEIGGFPDRAPSYPGNRWEYYTVPAVRNATFYLPVGRRFSGRELEVTLFCRNAARLRIDGYLI